MKKTINAIIVVEGKTDVQFLSSFIDADFVITNGSEISKDVLSSLKELSKTNKIIIMTDPDFPGKKIRNKINEQVPGCFNAFVDKKECIKKNKVGIAESSKTAILNSLEKLIEFDTDKNDTITQEELIELGFVGKNAQIKRNIISSYYCFDRVNFKTFLKRLNQLQLSKKEMQEVLKNER